MHSLPLPIAAYFAGVLSFLSPCVLPLVPGYVSLISGTSVEDLQLSEHRVLRTVMLHSLTFVLGFSVVFIALGAAATSIGQFAAEYHRWSSCIGPILATILVFAGAQETVFKGIVLLAIYSLGLAVPFLLTSLGVDRFLAFYGRFRRHLHTVEVVSGVLLIAIGVLIFLNNLKLLSGYLSFLNRFAL